MRANTASKKFRSEKAGILRFTVVAKSENVGPDYCMTGSEAGERERERCFQSCGTEPDDGQVGHRDFTVQSSTRSR